MSALLPWATCLWFLGAIGALCVGGIYSDEHPFDSNEAYYTTLFCAWLLVPLLIPAGVVALVLFALYKLGIGFRDLWRQFRPVHVKLPKATARKP